MFFHRFLWSSLCRRQCFIGYHFFCLFRVDYIVVRDLIVSCTPFHKLRSSSYLQIHETRRFLVRTPAVPGRCRVLGKCSLHAFPHPPHESSIRGSDGFCQNSRVMYHQLWQLFCSAPLGFDKGTRIGNGLFWVRFKAL